MATLEIKDLHVSVVTDEVAMPDGRYVERDYVRHIGAVAIPPEEVGDREGVPQVVDPRRALR